MTLTARSRSSRRSTTPPASAGLSANALVARRRPARRRTRRRQGRRGAGRRQRHLADRRGARARRVRGRPRGRPLSPGHLMRHGVRLGLDPGDARIGVARSDPSGFLATPVETVRRGKGDLARIARLAAEEDAVEMIVGLPRSLSGGEGPAAVKVRAFAGRLARGSHPSRYDSSTSVSPRFRRRLCCATGGRRAAAAGRRRHGRRGDDPAARTGHRTFHGIAAGRAR